MSDDFSRPPSGQALQLFFTKRTSSFRNYTIFPFLTFHDRTSNKYVYLDTFGLCVGSWVKLVEEVPCPPTGVHLVSEPEPEDF